MRALLSRPITSCIGMIARRATDSAAARMNTHGTSDSLSSLKCRYFRAWATPTTPAQATTHHQHNTSGSGSKQAQPWMSGTSGLNPTARVHGPASPANRPSRLPGPCRKKAPMLTFSFSQASILFHQPRVCREHQERTLRPYCTCNAIQCTQDLGDTLCQVNQPCCCYTLAKSLLWDMGNVQCRYRESRGTLLG